MPIPFRDAEDQEEMGAAAFLKIDSSFAQGSFAAALLLINGRGEPLEFSFNRIETPHNYLWRQSDIQHHAARKLAVSLLASCQRTPKIMLHLADEVPRGVFSSEIQVSVPVCCISAGSQGNSSPVGLTSAEGTLGLFWYSGMPGPETVEHRLFSRLVAGGLLTEPFERARAGLQEVYPPDADASR